MEKKDTRIITSEEKKQNLESSLYSLNKMYPFYGAFLSEVPIEHTDSLPTAALTYDRKKNEFKTLLNPNFFAELTPEFRVSILMHEILHFTHGHLFRMEFEAYGDVDNLKGQELENFLNDRHLKNIAADMAVNSFIKDLPDFVIRAENYKDKKGKPFPKFLTYEQYLELLKQNINNKHNKGKQQQYKVLDEHSWESLSEEEKSRMLQEAKKITERSMEKTSREFNKEQNPLSDLLKYLDSEITKLNYKQLLKYAIRRSMSKNNRTSTWTRPNKRYNQFAPGTRQDKEPFLNIYIDTSGSISHKEMNQFLKTVVGFLKAGADKAFVHLWHTELYHSERINKNIKSENLPFQSGGTDVKEVVEHINKTKPDLSIILTDGQFGKTLSVNSNHIIWVISDKYGLDHPYKDVGKTVLLNDT